MDLQEAQAPPVCSMHDYTHGRAMLLHLGTSWAPPHLCTMYTEYTRAGKTFGQPMHTGRGGHPSGQGPHAENDAPGGGGGEARNPTIRPGGGERLREHPCLGMLGMQSTCKRLDGHLVERHGHGNRMLIVVSLTEALA